MAKVDINALLGQRAQDPDKWLVQKDKLDFGPFTLRELIQQIEKGEVLESHIIVDRDTGERRPVSAIAELAPVAAAFRLAKEQQQAREAEKKSATVERGKGLVVGLVTLGIVAAVGGTVWFVLKKAQAIREEKARELVAAAAGIDVSGIKVETTVRAEPRKGGRRRRRGGPGNVDSFDGPLNLGDASRGGGDEQLSPKQINAVMARRVGSLAGCMGGERTVSIEFIVRGSGQVTAVRANGSTTSPLANCLRSRMRSISFPKFNGARTVASFSMSRK